LNAFVVFIRRPVFATMVTAFMVVIGLLSYARLGVDQFPNIDLPIVGIWTTLRGASPLEIETQVTKPIEEAVNTIGGIDELRSYSLEGVSYISVSFELDKDRDEVTQDVRDRVAMAMRLLPTGTDPPVVRRFDVDSWPVAGLAVYGPRDQRELRELTDKQIRPMLETVDGVGAIDVFGGWKRAVNIVLNGSKLQALGLSVREVAAAIRAQHVDIPGGRIQRGELELGLRTMARFTKVADFNGLVLAERQGRQVTLSDVGWAEDTYEDPRTVTRVWSSDDGLFQPAAVMMVRKQSGVNTLELVDRVLARLETVRNSIPADIRVEPIFESGTFIRRTINEVKLHLVLGAILASLVCFLFIRDWRATLIAGLAIPTSIITTFAFIKAMGYTLNNMTMMALTMSVGIVIDDAIVVLENIYRQMDENHRPPKEAAIEGLKEIALAVMATTTSLVVIFLPIAFMQGRPGRFIQSFGVTVAFAIMVSLLVSFVATPMLCSKWLRPRTEKRRNRFYEVIDYIWGHLLRWSLRHRWKTVFIAVGLFLSTFVISKALGTDFMPTDDRSMFTVKVEFPEGTSLRESNEKFRQIELDMSRLRGVKGMLAVVGDVNMGAEDVTKGTIFVSLVDLEERKFSQQEVMADARALRKKYVGAKVVVSEMHGIGGPMPVNFDIKGPDLDELYRLSNQYMDEMAKIPAIQDIDSSLSKRSPELQVVVDRPRASDQGVRIGEMALSLQAMVGGVRIGRFQEGPEQYDIWIRVREPDRSGSRPISLLPMGSLRGSGPVGLQHMAGFREGRGPVQIKRLDRQRTVNITAGLDGMDLGSAMREIGGIMRKVKFPQGYSFEIGGQGKVFQQMFSNFAVAFGLAFLFMYMILAAQFESFLHPITILLSLPLAIPCALLSLLILGESFNMYSGLGLLMLFGVVKKNGILQIDYTNTLRSRGLPRDEAILQANHVRLRPILMTTLTLIVGMIPIALGKGPGSGSRASMAKVIIGGQALSLVISLLIVPVAYSLFDDLGQKLRYRFSQGLWRVLAWLLSGLPVSAVCPSCRRETGIKEGRCGACGAPADFRALGMGRLVRQRVWLIFLGVVALAGAALVSFSGGGPPGGPPRGPPGPMAASGPPGAPPSASASGVAAKAGSPPAAAAQATAKAGPPQPGGPPAGAPVAGSPPGPSGPSVAGLPAGMPGAQPPVLLLFSGAGAILMVFLGLWWWARRALLGAAMAALLTYLAAQGVLFVLVGPIVLNAMPLQIFSLWILLRLVGAGVFARRLRRAPEAPGPSAPSEFGFAGGSP
jgi:HAE1 family hydrophobic/amphiphilic exporter-1